MNAERGFAPIAAPDARVLVLGSMPGRRSLDEHQYYGHPQNAFWRIVSQYTSVLPTSDYCARVDGLIRARIAVWDVIRSCIRPGSLDADIEKTSIEVNNIEQFFHEHSQIKAVYFNGGRAANEYRKRVLPALPPELARLPATQLLSTSPANARYSLDDKKANWAVIQPLLTST